MVRGSIGLHPANALGASFGAFWTKHPELRLYARRCVFSFLSFSLSPHDPGGWRLPRPVRCHDSQSDFRRRGVIHGESVLADEVSKQSNGSIKKLCSPASKIWSCLVSTCMFEHWEQHDFFRLSPSLSLSLPLLLALLLSDSDDGSGAQRVLLTVW